MEIPLVDEICKPETNFIVKQQQSHKSDPNAWGIYLALLFPTS